MFLQRQFHAEFFQNGGAIGCATLANFAVQYCVITAKFGGTAVTPEHLHFLKKILTPNHKILVVSAIGKRHFGDTKTTDLLYKFFVDNDEKYWQKVCQNYKQLVLTNGINLDVEKLLFEAKKQAKISLAHCLSLGEELCAKCVAKFVNGEFLDSQQLMLFGKNSVNLQRTFHAIQQATQGQKLFVAGGFYGGGQHGRQVFSRGGGDVSGAIFARATGSSLYENWTDVDGVCTVDPTLAKGGFVYKNLSYNQMFAMSQSGANVLHKSAVKVCQSVALPIAVGNFFSGKIGTVVSNIPSQNLFSVTQKMQKGIVATTVLHTLSQVEMASVLQRFLQDFSQMQVEQGGANCCQNSIYSISILPNQVVFHSKFSLLPLLWNVAQNCFSPAFCF